MKRYIVTIEEMITQDFEVQADNMAEALKIAEKQYKDGEFVLAPGNLVCKQISATDNEGDIVDWYEF